MATEFQNFISSDMVKTAIKNLLSVKFDETLFLSKGKEQTHQEKVKNITMWYRSQRLVMVLGAGASVSYGLPDWNTLLQKLLLITIKPEGEAGNGLEKAGVLARTFTKIFDPSSLISARYLHNYFKKAQPTSKLAFENAIRDSLYEGVSKDDSDLLKEIRQFCIAAGKSPNLDSIITYNYDDLLEECLKNIDVDIPFAAIHARGMKHEQHQLPIYHVHGYLPQKGQLTSKNRVVLSEDKYHEQYTDVYGWSNLIQINKFKDHNCLFIGLSFSDPNLRRLLDIAKNERGDDQIHHYCFKRKHDKNNIKNRLEKLFSEGDYFLSDNKGSQIEIEDVVVELVKLMEKFEENDALSFGVGIVWVSDYNEIPNILKSIRLGT